MVYKWACPHREDTTDRVKHEVGKLEGWIFTLEIAEKSLPSNAHIEHFARLRDMQDHFRRKLRELERPDAKTKYGRETS
ncbi:MAG: hypothetical protein AB1497_03525 [Bacillota bacterium]